MLYLHSYQMVINGEFFADFSSKWLFIHYDRHQFRTWTLLSVARVFYMSSRISCSFSLFFFLFSVRWRLFIKYSICSLCFFTTKSWSTKQAHHKISLIAIHHFFSNTMGTELNWKEQLIKHCAGKTRKEMGKNIFTIMFSSPNQISLWFPVEW